MKAVALAVLLFATPIVIDTTKLGEGGKTARFEGSRRVTVEKLADETIVRVEEGERLDTVTLHRGGRITRSDNGKMRPFTVLDRPHVIVDGFDLEPFITGGQGEPQDDGLTSPTPRPDTLKPGPTRYYLCPKDQSMLRVPNAPRDATYKCPVDGTVMREAVGSNKEYYLLE